MGNYDVIRIELNENPNENAVFTRMQGEIKKIKVWFNGKKVFDMDSSEKNRKAK